MGIQTFLTKSPFINLVNLCLCVCNSSKCQSLKVLASGFYIRRSYIKFTFEVLLYFNYSLKKKFYNNFYNFL